MNPVEVRTRLDSRQFTRQRKLTDFDIFRFLIGCSGGTLNKELRIWGYDCTPSVHILRQTGAQIRARDDKAENLCSFHLPNICIKKSHGRQFCIAARILC